MDLVDSGIESDPEGYHQGQAPPADAGGHNAEKG